MPARLGSRRFAWVWTGALVAAVCGCAKTGTVKGTATVDGLPAVGATTWKEKFPEGWK